MSNYPDHTELPDRPPRVLVVEDDPDQQELLREVLEDHLGRGCVTLAGSKAEALGHDFGDFDVVLSDYNLPDCTGMDILTLVTGSSRTPVIMVTGENVTAYAAEAVKRGAVDYIVKTPDYLDTVPLVVAKNLAMHAVLRERETTHQRQMRKLEADLAESAQQAATDPMTGLYNRRAFAGVLGQLFAETHRYGTDISAVMLDMDRFKTLNDTLGHAAGDELIKLCGRCILENLRRMDVGARYGGDEFVLLFPKADAQTATNIVRRLRDQFWADSAKLLGRPEGVTMSVGVADASGSGATNADELVKAADAVLYKAKDAGRDCIHGQGFCLPRVPPAEAA